MKTKDILAFGLFIALSGLTIILHGVSLFFIFEKEILYSTAFIFCSFIIDIIWFAVFFGEEDNYTSHNVNQARRRNDNNKGN